MSIKRTKKVETEDTSKSTVISSKLQIKNWLEIISAVVVIGGVIFGLGYWVAGIELKVEILNLNQKHINEMSELRLQMNNQIQSLQNKYDILEASYNALKERKEDNHGK